MTASAEHLAIWDLLSLTVKWSVPLDLATLIADPLSSYMAVFTTENTREFPVYLCFVLGQTLTPIFVIETCVCLNNFSVFVFTPGSSEPVYTRKNVLEKDVSVLGACFVPNLQSNVESTVQWQKKSQFFFLDSEQVGLSYLIIVIIGVSDYY